MDFRHLFFSMDGRINRGKFWLALLVLLIIQWAVYLAAAVYFGATQMAEYDPNQPPPTGFLIFFAVLILAFLWPSLCVYAKRWHDRDKSGWWTLIALIPIAGGIWLLVECGLLRGTDGENRFGPDPLAR